MIKKAFYLDNFIMTSFILVASLLLVLVVLAWGLDKGFDIYDEGIYLMHSLPNQETLNPSFWWVYLRFIFGMQPPSVLANRVVRLISTIITNLFFSIGFLQWFKRRIAKQKNTWPAMLIPLFLLVGGLVSFIHGPLSYSYNHMNSHLILIWAGWFLFILSRESEKESKVLRDLRWIILGFFVCLQFFAKFPSGFLTVFFIVFSIFVYDVNSGITLRLRTFLAFTIGIGFGALFTLMLMGGTQPIENYLNQTPYIGDTTSRHTPWFILFYAYLELFNEGKYLFTYYLPLLVSIYLLILVSQPSKPGYLKFNKALLLGALLGYFFYSTFLTAQRSPYPTFQISNLLLLGTVLLASGNHFVGFPSKVSLAPKLTWWKIPLLLVGILPLPYISRILLSVPNPWLVNVHKVVFSVLVSLIIVLVILYTENFWKTIVSIFKNEKHLVIFLLLVLPFLGAFGTNTGLIEKSVDLLAPWFAVMVILFHGFLWQSDFFTLPVRKITNNLLFSFIGIISSIQLLSGYVLHPYHQSENLLHQKSEVKNSERLKGIKLDRETRDFYEALVTLIQENTSFQMNDPVIGLYDIPGFVYAIGGLSPGSNHFPKVVDINASCRLLSESQMEDLDRAIILSIFELTPANAACFLDNDIDIVNHYHLLGKLSIPYEYLQKRGQEFLYIYAPLESP